MKKNILILVGILGIFASNIAKAEAINSRNFEINFNYNDAVNFFERGVEFFVFANGDFDFDTSNSYQKGIRIDRDFRGRIRSVGNVFINYDRFGNVTRIGSVFINYHRGQLASVGDLRVFYDRYGYPVFRGNVNDFYYDNGVRFSVNFGRIYNYNDSFFTNRDFDRSYTRFREDLDFYYYKSNRNNNIADDNLIIKRRKTSDDNNNRRETARNLNSYRKSEIKDDSRTEVVRNNDESRKFKESNNRRIISKRNETGNRKSDGKKSERRRIERN
ncbi:MAG: hypothetical protein NWS84_00845 [Polaribacter sp.]|jgi:hypothetical protein|nr:hypothetical protein [Polaribacter sp.]MDP4704685.1 hypothetical protein [Polaribacter sp.]